MFGFSCTEMVNGLKQTTNLPTPNSMNPFIPMTGNFNGSFHLPDNNGFSATWPPPAGSFTSPHSVSMHAISPNLLLTDQGQSIVSAVSLKP
jgi:hypothetical protein